MYPFTYNWALQLCILFGWLWFSVLPPSVTKRTFLDEEWRPHLSVGVGTNVYRLLLGVMLVLQTSGCRFSSSKDECWVLSWVSSNRNGFSLIEEILWPTIELLVTSKVCIPLLYLQGYHAMLLMRASNQGQQMYSMCFRSILDIPGQQLWAENFSGLILEFLLDSLWLLERTLPT